MSAKNIHRMNINGVSSRLTPGHTSVGRVRRCTDLVGCVLTWIPGSSQALTLLAVAKLITWRQRRPFLKECQRVQRHLRKCRVCLGDTPAPGPTFKKALYHTRPPGGTYDKYRPNYVLFRHPVRVIDYNQHYRHQSTQQELK